MTIMNIKSQDRYDHHDHQDQLDRQVRASVQGPRQPRAAANSRPLQVGRVTLSLRKL